MCSESGVLLLLDEVITGFRLGYRGAQDFFGVKADLASFGKVLGGGMPIGAIAGSDDVMGCFSQTRPQTRMRRACPHQRSDLRRHSLRGRVDWYGSDGFYGTVPGANRPDRRP